jgi:uncharacterized membrane protein
MSLTPLLAAPAVVQVHAFAALAALGLGVVQLAGVKGGTAHRWLGWGWVVLMSLVALTSAGITVRNGPGHYSFIHGISAGVMLLLTLAIWRIRRGDIRRHARAMTGVFIGGLIIAGGFTLLPGRIMHEVIFGLG